MKKHETTSRYFIFNKKLCILNFNSIWLPWQRFGVEERRLKDSSWDNDFVLGDDIECVGHVGNTHPSIFVENKMKCLCWRCAVENVIVSDARVFIMKGVIRCMWFFEPWTFFTYVRNVSFQIKEFELLGQISRMLHSACTVKKELGFGIQIQYSILSSFVKLFNFSL